MAHLHVGSFKPVIRSLQILCLWTNDVDSKEVISADMACSHWNAFDPYLGVNPTGYFESVRAVHCSTLSLSRESKIVNGHDLLHERHRRRREKIDSGPIESEQASIFAHLQACSLIFSIKYQSRGGCQYVAVNPCKMPLPDCAAS